MDSPYEEQENLKQARGEYENQYEPDMEGVSCFDIQEPTVEEAFAEPDQLQRALMAYRIIELDQIRKAAKETTTQDTFLMDAMKRNGVL